MPSLEEIIKKDLAKGETSAARLVHQTLGSLSPRDYYNYNSITHKYPGMSSDVVMSMVKQGFNAQTPGLDNVTTMDGIASLKSEAFKLDTIKKSQKSNSGVYGIAQSAFKEGVYDPLKGLSRFTFAALGAIYDNATNNFRNMVSYSRREKGMTVGKLTSDFLNPWEDETRLGQMLQGKGTGSGFFITPQTQAGAAQGRAMREFGLLNGQSFTMGRAYAGNILGLNPTSNAYKIMSGMTDATLNVLTDPSIWFGPGALGKVAVNAGKAGGHIKTVSPLTKTGMSDEILQEVAELEKAGLLVKDKISGKISSPYKRYASKAKRKEQEILAVESAITARKIKKTEKVIRTEKNFLEEPADATVAGVLSAESIAEWIVTHPKTQTGELSQAVSKLKADSVNTGGFFDGQVILDTIPEYGKITIGVNDGIEYAITANSTAKLKFLDLGDDFTKASPKQRVMEADRRSRLADDLRRHAEDFPEDPSSRFFFQLAEELKSSAASLDGFIGSLYLAGDELVAAKTLGSLIADNMSPNNTDALGDLFHYISGIYRKKDGFSNIRSIYGETGGFVLTGYGKFAARRADIGRAAHDWSDPENVAKFTQSVKTMAQSLASHEDDLANINDDLSKLKADENYFTLLRDKAHNDPKMLRELIQDPDNVGIKGLLKLELEFAEKNLAKEVLMSKVGLTDGFMGNVADDFSKPLAFILGRNFEKVAELIASQKDVVKIRNLFKGKLDDNIIKELADASTTEDVLKVFLNQFVPGADLPAIRKALSTGAKIAVNPVARMVPFVPARAIKASENLDRVFNRLHIRSTVVSLGDVTRLNTVVENWMSSVGLTHLVRSKIITQKQLEDTIANTQRAIFKATTNPERAAAVHNGIDELMSLAGKALGMTDEEIKQLQVVARITNSEKVIQESYALSNALGNKGGGIVFNGTQKTSLHKGILESQTAHNVMHLPDSRKVFDAIIKYKTNIPLYGKARAMSVAAHEANDLWRTAQLVGRVSYVIRNVAEMQMRQFLSGHISMFNNPIGFLAMVVGNPAGNRLQKLISKTSKYNVNAMGQFWKSQDAELELSASLIESRAMINRGHSVGDFGGTGRTGGAINVSYKDVQAGHPEYLNGLAWTINNFSSDAFMPDVIRVMASGKKQAQLDYVDNLIKTFDEPDNKLRSFLQSIYKDNEGLRDNLLINPGLETGPGVVATNVNRQNILTWLFDADQTDTVVGQLNLLAGNGSQRNLVLDLIRDGSVKTTVKGKPVVLSTPYRQLKLTSDQVMLSEKKFTELVGRAFTVDGMTGGLAKVATKTSEGGAIVSQYKRFGNWFFTGATWVESRVNFGPEFHQVYWDHIAGYATMLDTPELKVLLKNAKKAFSPILGRGTPRLRRSNMPLRIIDKEYRKRLKNPDYIHTGGTTLRTIDEMAAEQGANHVAGLFYDATSQKQWANAYRLAAPFAQAQYNTIHKWMELGVGNPVPMYKFGKAFEALTDKGSNVIYDVTNTTYDDSQGFFYKDENNPQYRFKTPIVGSVIGALVGGNANALQLTSPVESLNLAFGAVSPFVPGMGPATALAYKATGRTQAFGPIDDILKDIVTPFGEPKTATDIIFPAWLKKASNAFFGDDAATQRGVKDWAANLASTGEYGENPLANEKERNRLFNDAEKMAKWANIATALFQSITPATPTQEVLLSIKNPNNKMNFMTMTMIYKEWQSLQDKHPGDHASAVRELSDKFGMKNLLIAISGTTPGSRGTEDAWTFLNNNPSLVENFAVGNKDITPYFYPGGEYALKYYNWQKSTGQRRQMSTLEIQQEAEGLVYSMLKDQVVEKQIEGHYTDIWYTEQIAVLNKQFGNSRPIDTVVTNVSDVKIGNFERALETPAFESSDVYPQAVEFYGKFKHLKDHLNMIKVSNYSELSSKAGVPYLMREELVALGEKLMTENPKFSRMYYGLFAGILKEEK